MRGADPRREGGPDYRPFLRWYPAAWRARYGGELEALLEDTLEGGPVPWSLRWSLARSGVSQRLRSAHLTSSDGTPEERARAGSLLVLAAWALFVVGGAGFAKFTEHWQDDVAAPWRPVPQAAFDAVAVLAVVVVVTVLTGAALALPALVRLVRHGRWSEVRRPVALSVALAVAAGAAVTGLVWWAHHQVPAATGVPSWRYQGAGAGLVVVGLGALWAATAAAAAVVRVGGLGRRTLRLEATLALTACGAMVLMTVAAAVWWGTVASAAPQFFAPQLPWPSLAPQMVLAMVVMVAATAAAAYGSVRIVRSWPRAGAAVAG